ncbi:MAG TPA: KH domain-containing protein [Candidatus Saccharimonadales bacterium]
MDQYEGVPDMSSIDQQFVEFIVKSLVSNPDAVSVERRIDEKGVLLELTVDPEDLGRVIGKRGATAQSLRTLLRALGTKNDARYNLKIVDNGVQDDSRSSYQSDNSSNTNSTTSSSDSDDEDDSNESVVSKTRKELEELDDLDV